MNDTLILSYENGFAESFNYKDPSSLDIYNEINLKKIITHDKKLTSIFLKPSYIAVFGKEIYDFGFIKIINPSIVLIANDNFMRKNKSNYYAHYTDDKFSIINREVNPLSTYPTNILFTNMIGNINVLDDQHIGEYDINEFNKIKYIQIFQMKEGFSEGNNYIVSLFVITLIMALLLVFVDLTTNENYKLNIDLDSLSFGSN